MRIFNTVGILAVLTATAAIAHDGVKNPTVKARMQNMSSISDNIKILGAMAKGASDFDADAARAAAVLISDHASQISASFESEEDDPLSEAKPEIWMNFDDFSMKATELGDAAFSASETIQSLDDLRGAVRSIGATCGACHKVYRE